MSDYSKTYNGAAKDAAEATVLGVDFDTEFDAISTAIATKANKNVPSATGNVATLSASGDLQDSGYASSNFLTVELLEAWTPTAVNSKDFTWNESIYGNVIIELDGVKPSTNSPLRLQFGYNNGGTFVASGYINKSVIDNSSYGETAGVAITGDSSATTSTGVSERITTIGLSSSGVKSVQMDGYFTYQIASYLINTQVMDSVRLIWDTGNFATTGSVRVYGIRLA